VEFVICNSERRFYDSHRVTDRSLFENCSESPKSMHLLLSSSTKSMQLEPRGLYTKLSLGCFCLLCIVQALIIITLTSFSFHVIQSLNVSFTYARNNLFFGICRYDSNSGGEREIQRTMLELLNQLDGFDSRGDVKVKMGF